MYRIRTVKTSSGASAIQVVEYSNNQRTILFHAGSAVNEEELSSLKKVALGWIEKNILLPINSLKIIESNLLI